MRFLEDNLKFSINNIFIGQEYSPFIIAEAGINHNGDFRKAKKLILAAYHAGARCVKFQCHVIEDEMLKTGNNNRIYNLISRCSFTENEEKKLKQYTEFLGMVYLSTPFSILAVDRLERLNVSAYKIGSGECNNYPLVKYIASFGKPVILSTGMNDWHSIRNTIKILKSAKLVFAVLQCTSIYPTPYDKLNLGVLAGLRRLSPVYGLSDHSIGNYTAFAAVALGASIIEKHFTVNNSWQGPDNKLSLDPAQLKELIHGCNAVHSALGNKKIVLPEEKEVIMLSNSSVVTTRCIKKKEVFSKSNIWVMKPGDGEFKAKDYESLLGKRARTNIDKNVQLSKKHVL